MSTVYSTEPATTGRVVIETTHGPIDINLWCKECPTTTRTFLQLCLDGYYNNMIFHRILSEFLIQTGLTTNGSMMGTCSARDIDGYLRQSTAVPSASSSSGSNSMAMSGDVLGLDRKKLELNPRIRFNHRGQVAMAFPLEEKSADNNENEEENAMLRYQFFVTLDEAPFLDAKHVVFGTIAGATMFNALRIGRTDTDEQTGIPTDLTDAPPRIKSIRIDHHPFEDLVVTADKNQIPWKKDTNNNAGGKDGKDKKSSSAMEKRRKKRKGKRDLNVLSFGDEERDFDEETTTTGGSKNGKKKKGGSMLSSHDVLAKESKFLSSEVDADVDKRIKEKDAETKSGDTGKKDSYETKQTKMRFVASNEASKNNNEPDLGKQESKSVRIKEDRDQGTKQTTKSKSIGAVEARRAKYLKSGSASSANKKERLKKEGDTMAKLFAFKSKVLETNKGSSKKDGTKKHAPDDSLAARMAKRMKQTEDEEELRNKEEEAFVAMPGYSGQVNQYESDNNDDAKDEDWMRIKFKCKQHIDNNSRTLDKIGDGDDMGGDGRLMDDYVVLDEKRNGKGSGRSHKSSSHHRPR